MVFRFRQILAVGIILFGGYTLSGQSIGGGASLIFDGGSFGLQGRYEQYVTETIEGSAQFTFFLNNGSFWGLDVDGHYNLTSADQFRIYPLGGLNLTGGNGDTEIGINFGLGGAYPLKESMEVFAEFKYTIISYESATLQAGVLFPFGGGKDK